MAFRYGFLRPNEIFLLVAQYRRTGVRIGDVGIITPYGEFSFFFNICLPRDDPINPRLLPEHLLPISEATDIDCFSVFGHGSHLASTSVANTQASSQSSYVYSNLDLNAVT